MNDYIEIAVVINVGFNEVITAAKCADTQKSLVIVDVIKTAEFKKVYFIGVSVGF